MHTRRGRSLLLLGFALFCSLVLAGCLELTGQRIRLRYDADRDRLLVLLCHDGIHESSRRTSEKGAEQLAAHLENGDIMLFDWYGRIRRDDVRKTAEAEDTPPALRALCRAFVADVTAHAVGHYVDPGGRIGAAQLVVVENAAAFVRKANAAIHEALIATIERDRPSDLQRDMPRSFELWAREARRDRSWISLHGSAIELSFPVVRAEWARKKAEMVTEICEAWKNESDHRQGDTPIAQAIQLLTGEGFAFAELGDVVTISLGGHSEPRTMRAIVHGSYNTELEDAVRRLVPGSFDELLAARLLADDEDHELEPWQDLALSLAAPEDRVRAVLGARLDVARAAAAEAWLRAFAEEWNDAGRLPAAPARDEAAAAWQEWYRDVLAFPVDPRHFEPPQRDGR